MRTSHQRENRTGVPVRTTARHQRGRGAPSEQPRQSSSHEHPQWVVDFGDDTSRWARDRECDDPRFEGGYAGNTLLEEDRGHDASDCRQLYEAGLIRLFGVDLAFGQVYFEDDSSEYTHDGEGDDIRFSGTRPGRQRLPAAVRGRPDPVCSECVAADYGKHPACTEAGAGETMVRSLDANIAQPKNANPNPTAFHLVNRRTRWRRPVRPRRPRLVRQPARVHYFWVQVTPHTGTPVTEDFRLTGAALALQAPNYSRR